MTLDRLLKNSEKCRQHLPELESNYFLLLVEAHNAAINEMYSAVQHCAKTKTRAPFHRLNALRGFLRSECAAPHGFIDGLNAKGALFAYKDSIDRIISLTVEVFELSIANPQLACLILPRPWEIDQDYHIDVLRVNDPFLSSWGAVHCKWIAAINTAAMLGALLQATAPKISARRQPRFLSPSH